MPHSGASSSLPDASGALGMATGSVAAATPTEKMTVGGAVPQGHLARNFKLPRRCLACSNRGDNDVAHVSGCGSCPVFWEELRRLRGRN